MTPATAATGPKPPEIVYPSSDGKPMAESYQQARWITLLYGNLSAQYRDRDDVVVAADNFWYPVEGEPQTVFAPDVYVVFGRPKHDRGSYMQWKEGGIPITVVFEILSRANTREEMDAKFDFYDEHGVEEYYVYDPDANKLDIRLRGRQTLYRVDDIKNFVSPRLGIRFEMTQPEMTVYGQDGEPFRPFEEERRIARAAKTEAAESKRQADEAKRQADEAKRQADEAKRQTADEATRADSASRRAARLAELGRKARRDQASPEEVAELERLEDESM
jgi:Uma2 family endonuclease